MQDLRIKRVEEADRSFVLHCLHELQEYETRLHDTRRRVDAGLCERYLDEICQSAHTGNVAVLLASIAKVPVGFVCFWVETDSSPMETDDSNRFGYISDIYVLDEHRKKGIAGRMIEEVRHRLMQDASIKRLRIGALAANVLAASAYEAAGFQPYEIIYEKRLR